MNTNYVICIGRQPGSGGLLIGKKLAQELGLNFYDKELLQLASQESGLGKEFFEKYDEKTIHNLYGGLVGIQGSFMGEINAGYYLNNENLFSIQSKVIRNLAEKESCIFVGRCSDYILKEHPRCLSVFITADICDRVKRVSQDLDLNESKAIAYLNKMDKKRANYYNYFTNKKWGEATSYHISINSSVLGIDSTVEIIKEIVKRRFEIE